MNTLVKKLKNIPLLIWILLISAFFLGFIIRGGGNHEQTTDSHDHANAENVDTWTCSMHPQIKLPEPGQCPICFMDLIPLESGNRSDIETQLTMSAAAVKLAEIRTTPVRRAAARAEVFLSGRVEVDESRQKTISARFPGRIERLFVDYTGTSVNKGEHLANIYSAELYASQEELIQARQRADVTSMDQAINQKSARANLRAARQKLRLAGLTEDQIDTIENQDSPSEQITIYSPLSGIVTRKFANQGDYVETGTKLYTITDLSQVWVIFDAYESDLFWLNYAQTVKFEVEALPGEIFTGRIAFIDPILNPQTRTVSVRVNMSNPDGKLKPGMFVNGKIQAELDAAGNSINPQLAGKWISPMHPEIVKDHPGSCDVCGMPLVKAEKLGIVKKPASDQLPLLVPASAVLKTGKRAIVYVEVPDTEEPTFESRTIQIGTRAGDHYIVRSGLRSGEKVVIHGNFKIDSAMQLAAKPSMMHPATTDDYSQENERKSGSSAATTAPRAIPDIPADFRNDLTPIYETYFKIQTALAEDHYQHSIKQIRRLHEHLDTFDISHPEINPQIRSRFLLVRQRITDQTRHARHWQSIADIRKAFESISNAVLELERSFGHSGDLTFFESYCPMAFDNKGAFWLASDKQINNPYFGAKMLRCGEVTSSFPAVQQGEYESHGD